MIARAAVYSENGCQCLLRVHKKAPRTQRSLHSGFWCHGAGNIDLPAWWIFFLQIPQANKENYLLKGSRAAANIILSNIRRLTFLDFLYPMQTLATIPRFARKDRTVLNSRHQARNTLRPSRAYTSISTIAAYPIKTLDTSRSNVLNRAFSDNLMDAQARYEELLNLNSTEIRQNEAWHCYQIMRKLSYKFSAREISKLIAYLSRPGTASTIERLTTLIHEMPKNNKRWAHPCYRLAVSAALSQDDFETALAFHQDAESKIRSVVGASLIICYAVEKAKWVEALEICKNYLDYKRLVFFPPGLWNRVKSLPFELLTKIAASAAAYVTDVSAEAEAEASTETAVLRREFALQIIGFVFSVRKVPINLTEHQDILKKAVALKKPGLELYKSAIFQLLSVNNQPARSAAFGYYSHLKENPDLTPDKPLLNGMIAMFNSTHDDSGIQLVYDDYRTYREDPPSGTVEATIEDASFRGSIKLVWSIVHQYPYVLQGTSRQRIFNLILKTYCMRGEVDSIVSQFQSLQDDHGFIPDLRSWNAVLATYARIGDIDGALMWFDKLVEAGMRPDAYSYSALMLMYAKRGDLEAVIQFFEQTEAEGIKPSIAMIDSIVTAYAKNGRLDAACELVEKALQMDFRQPRTRMWNSVIQAYAMTHNIYEVSKIRKRMNLFGVPLDSMTYASILHSLRLKHPDLAWKTVREILPRAGVPIRNIHYAICMSGYLSSREHDRLIEVYDHMLQQGIKPTYSEQRMLLISAARVDRHGNESLQSGPKQLQIAESMLKDILPAMDMKEFATNEPKKLLGKGRLDEAYSSGYFTHLMYVYGREACFDKVAELYDLYLESATKFQQGSRRGPPIEMLRALMAANLTADDHGEVERCWYLALDKAEQISRSRGAITAGSGWVLKDRRWIMNPCLSLYMLSLERQNRIDDISVTVDDLRRCGYEIDTQCLNVYIKTLACNDRVVLAFETCEREFMDDWHGWRRYEFMLQALPTRVTRHAGHIRIPNFTTFVYLAQAYAKMGADDLREVVKVAPKTTTAVRDIPESSLRDKIVELGLEDLS